MKVKFTNDLKNILVIVIGSLLIITITLQIIFANSNTTKLETTLFSILQFVFSLAFAWLISRLTLKEEFMESQKKFAYSAFRRINEIDKGIERILRRIHYSNYNKDNSKACIDLEVIDSLAQNIRENIKSSIADWGDIIGEEIRTFEQIEQIKEKKEQLLNANEDLSSETNIKIKSSNVLDEINTNEKDFQKLFNSLPKTLQLSVKEENTKGEDGIMRFLKRLEKEKERNGYIKLTGFWDNSFSHDICDMMVGEKLYVSVDDVGTRTGALIAKDTNGNSVGVITNKSFLKYFEFTEAIIRYFEASRFECEIISIESSSKEKERHYFKVKTIN